MDLRRRIFRWVAGWFIPVIMLSACGLGEVSLAKVTPQSPSSMVIFTTLSRNYSGPHGVLNISVDADGLPNVLTRTPPTGQTESGLTATLWLVITDRPGTYTSFRVQSGQTISFEGYEIKILRIAEYDRGAYYVEVEVSEGE
ncbi:MAG: hypothetical protein JW748_11150 [Anaerolineales bacterium]|nr:hypothetical protein [Anaerolineales bacterium]